MIYKKKQLTRLITSIGLMALSGSTLANKPAGNFDDSGYQDLPWMTGPILAAAGHVVTGGHVNWEPYLFSSDAAGTYNNTGKVVRSAATVTTQPMLSLSIGVTQWMDFQAIIPYNFNNHSGQSDNNWADITLMFGLQAMTDKENSWWYPDLRVTLEETFPSGKYENLNPALLSTDSTGVGSYQSSIGLNFQKLWKLGATHFLRGRLTYTYTIPTSVNLHGYNAFGGSETTNGNMNIGNKSVVDLAFEYSVTVNWVLASDFVYNNSKSSVFTGTSGVSGIAGLNQGSGHQYSVTPSIEYNWNAKVGVIAGAWLTVGGENTADFSGGAVAFNYYD